MYTVVYERTDTVMSVFLQRPDKKVLLLATLPYYRYGNVEDYQAVVDKLNSAAQTAASVLIFAGHSVNWVSA